LTSWKYAHIIDKNIFSGNIIGDQHVRQKI
jgi:hypothetical protein